MLTIEEEEKIRAAIDRFAWKHSWHLPTNHFGYIDWCKPATLAKCRGVLEEYRTMCLAFACTCDTLAGRIAEEQASLEREAAEEQEER